MKLPMQSSLWARSKYFVFLLFLIFPYDAISATQVFYASPSGSPLSSGQSPDLATSLEQAQILSRNFAASGSDTQVILLAGRYELSQTLKFGPLDSNVSYEAAPNARVILSGGSEVSGWIENSPHVFQVKIPPALKNFRQLYAFNAPAAPPADAPAAGVRPATRAAVTARPRATRGGPALHRRHDASSDRPRRGEVKQRDRPGVPAFTRLDTPVAVRGARASSAQCDA